MKRPSLLGLAAVTALAACATKPPEERFGPPAPTSADRHRIAVEQTSERVSFPVQAMDAQLSQGASEEISLFARSYIRIGHGPVVVSVPANGANAAAAERVAHDARMQLVDQGVPYSAIASASYDAAGVEDAPIVLSFARFAATAPHCAPLWEQDLAHPDSNRPWESFGCATAANLAAMIADPADLVGPRTEDPRDSGRRAVVFDRYRQGQATGAERTADERATVSTAVR